MIDLTGPMTSRRWTLHPGDWVVAELVGDSYRILFRTPSELEMQTHLRHVNPVLPVIVFQVRGLLP